MDVNMDPVIIIGMHRAGTSMLTRFLEEAGIFMGKDKGINDESLFFQHINNWSLFQANCTWDNPYNIQFMNEFLLNNLHRTIENRLSSIFLSRYSGISKFLRFRSVKNFNFKWGWKDPRNTLLMPLWSRIFPGARIIHIYRNPLDVAGSLMKREYSLEKKFTPNFRIKRIETFLKPGRIYYQSSRVHNIDEGIKLWKEYTEIALDSSRYFKNTIHIRYEDLAEDTEKCLAGLFDFLGIGKNKDILNSISAKIDKSRSLAFINDPDSLKVYEKYRSDDIFAKLNYDKLI
ncbi:MAG: sulfotransferase [Acidobacteriota bacterium]